MKNVLIVTYHYPPEGGPAVQRVCKFVKYLKQYGYRCFVLTAKKRKGIIDEDLMSDVADDLEIHKTRDIGQYIPGDIRKMMPKIFLPDKMCLWNYTAISEGVNIVNDNNISLIFSTSPPHSVHMIAATISDQTNVPFIADFRDEWVGNSLFKDCLYKDKHSRLESWVVSKARHLISVTKGGAESFKRRYLLDKVSVIRNGFDPDDFKDINIKPSRNSEQLRVCYAGRLNQLHSPEDFFEALNELIVEEKIIDMRSIFIDFIGSDSKKDWLIKFPELNSIVSFSPYKPHKQVLEKMNQSDVLLLLATNMNGTEFIPAKLYEYFALKKPIFAIVPEIGELRSLISEASLSYIAYQNKKSIKEEFIKLYSDWKNGRVAESMDNTKLFNYSRERLTKKLADLFDANTVANIK